MAPISDTEIAFLRLDPQTTRGVAIYDVVNGTITDVASTADFTGISESKACSTSRRGQIAALFKDEFNNSLIMTYTKGNAKVKVYRSDGQEITSPETQLVPCKVKSVTKAPVSPKAKAPASPKTV